MRILNRFSQENESQASTLVIISSKFNCYDVFRAQGWRVVPLIRLARLAVRLAQVCECSFNHTNPNSNLRISHKPYGVVSLVYIFSSLSQSPLTVTAGSILLLKHLMRFVSAGSEFITSVLVCRFFSIISRCILWFNCRFSSWRLVYQLLISFKESHIFFKITSGKSHHSIAEVLITNESIPLPSPPKEGLGSGGEKAAAEPLPLLCDTTR